VRQTKESLSLTDKMNLLVTIDRKYIQPLITMLCSYRDTHKNIETDVYVAHCMLEPEDFRHIETDIASDNIHLHSVKITEHYFRDIPVLERLPEESFYRLLAFEYLPKEIDRCLYLDPDIYIRKSLTFLYAMELDGHYLAAAGHMHGFVNGLNKVRLGCNQQKRYLNSGIMLMNLKEIRKDFTLQDVLECLEENAQRLILGDQDMTNILFGNKTILLDERIYNLDERTYKYYNKRKAIDLDTVENETAIIHYNGKFKPWNEGYEGVLNIFYPMIDERGAAPNGIFKKQVKSIYRITKPTKQQSIVITGFILCFLFCLFFHIFFGKELVAVISEPEDFRGWLNQFGAFDEIAFITIRAVQTVIKFFPAEPLEIASGYAWGAVPGMLYCVIGNMIGTVIIFALTRKYGKKIIGLFLPVKNMKTIQIFKSSNNIYVLLFFLYLIPGSPKDGFTYFVGLLPVNILPFMIITFIARMPSVLSSTLCGATLAEKNYLISALIFAATIILAVLGGLIYRAYSKRRMVRIAKNS